MLVHAKTPRIKVHLSGTGVSRLVDAVRSVYPDIRVVKDEDEDEDEDGDELVDITTTDWYKRMRANHHPGDTIRVYRNNAGWTLAQLAEKTGIAESHLSAMENRKRGVGKVSAMRLSKALGRDYRRFL